ncbi:DMT family transporter [bacterium]|nr:DMT family transporter [bacterium]
MKPNNQRKIKLDAALAGPLFMLSSALLFTALNLMVKLMRPEYTVWHIGFFRFMGGVLVLLAVFGRKTNPYRGDNTRLLIIRGCVGSIAFISLITAIRILPVSTALVIFYTFPVFSAVASFLIFKERLGKPEIVCMMIVIVGVGMLLDFRMSEDFFGQLLALLAGVFAGLTVTLIRSLRKKNGPVIIYLYFCTMGALVTFPMFAADPILPATSVEWVMILGIIFSSVSAQLLMNQGFFYCRGWEGGVFMSSEVIFTAIVGIVFLGDPVSWRFWTGGLLIMGSVVALNRLNAEKQSH